MNSYFLTKVLQVITHFENNLYTFWQPTKQILKLYSWKQSTVLQLDTHDK